ncbi:MAG TPA: undecaprenyldiphospho-muramoylpentapeptide beta-N-acetylglucosaminyltransferase [Bacillota bacterium]|nr:undecaprenyldiphospho-muramoylpentapeptide beta-N-acetylglucosaminyltransferase [Bacillota bacterium]
MTGSKKPWRLLVTGGGTGGHIYPALAIAKRAAERFPPVQVLYVGAQGGMEASIVPEAGLRFEGVPVSGIVRKRPLQVAAGLLRLGAGEARALGLLLAFRPDVVVATGGYAAGPVGLAAWLAGAPLVLQEQNMVPGVTNRLLSRVAVGVAVPHPDAGRAFPRRAKIWVVGNPIRRELMQVDRAEARARLGLPVEPPVVLMVAGSRGSAVFVRLLREMSWSGPAELLFVAGRAHYEAAKGLTPRVLPYLEDAGLGYAAADLVVCRAGAITLAELAALGKPALLIPSPHVTHHHQEANAAVFAKAGAAVVLPEAGLDGQRLAAVVGELLADPGRLQAMAAAMRAMARPDALDDLVERIHALV